MPEKIFVLEDSGTLHRMNEADYESEALLQDLLCKYSDLLSGEQIDVSNPRKWLFISKEYPVASSEDGAGRWYVDHLFVDQDAVPTIVEVKRSSDTRIRREVVGQVLEYAANARLFWSSWELRSYFESNHSKDDPREVFGACFSPETDYDEFWSSLEGNLKSGKMRLLFVADAIPPELRKIIEYLNEEMKNTEVLGLEVKQFISESGLKTLVPKIIGQTSEALSLGKSRKSRQWDEESLYQSFREQGREDVMDIARTLLQWSREHCTRVWFGRGINYASFIPVVESNAVPYQLFVLYAYGRLEIPFYYYHNKKLFKSPESRMEILEKFNQVKGIHLPPEAITKRPSLDLKIFLDKETLDGFFSVLNWLIRKIES